MRTALFWLLVVVLVGGSIAGALFLLQPKPELHHPDFGTDCTDLLTPRTENAVDCVRVFYGTNRDVKVDGNAPGPTEEKNTKDVVAADAEALQLGRADIWLPKLIEEGGTRERGETPYLKGETPDDDEELAKYVFITRITAAGREHFFADMDDALVDSGSFSLLLFVHGFNTPFEDALVRSAQLSVDLSRRDVFDVGVPVLFSWPSAGKVSLDDYRGDRDLSLAAAPYLEEFLDLLTDNADIDRINIVAHSMGNRVLTQALEDYADNYLTRHPDSHLEFRIILVAADVDREIFDATTGILDNLKANVTIYTSDADRALQVSTLVNQKKRLGDTDGDKPYIRENEFYQTVDASSVATELFGLGHNYYSDNPFILGDILCAMSEANPEVRALERLHYAGTPDGLEYFRVNAAVEPGDEECSLFRDAFPLTDVSQAPDDERFEPMTLPPPPPTPAPRTSEPPTREMAPAPLAPRELTLYVSDRDSFDPASLAPEFMPAVNGGGIEAISISVHTDTVGSADVNMARTQSWGDQLKAYIANAAGISPDIITVEAMGDTNPAIATPDETDEPQNRRIILVIEYTS